MSDETRLKALKWLLHIIFFLSGIATVLIGQVLPIMATRFQLNDLQVSLFFPSQFAGSLIGTYLTSLLAKRNNYMAAAMLGGAFLACGLMIMNLDSFGFAIFGFFLIGMGIGLSLPSINMMIVEVDPERSGPALNILNFCWGVGAIVCKPFVDLFSTQDSVGLTTVLLAVPLFVFSFALRLTVGTPKNSPLETTQTESDDPRIWRMPLAWSIAAFNFLHVGFESGMGGWLTTYTTRIDREKAMYWLSPTLLFFLLFVIGRGIAPFLFRFFNENKMLFLGLVIVLVGMIVTLAATTFEMLGVGSAIAGFGTSWIFPTNVSRFTKTFGRSATRQFTPLFMCGTLGSAAVTWLIGFISERTGDLRSGMYVLLVGVVLLLIVQSYLAFASTGKVNDITGRSVN